jgi:RNA polymerase sigma-70 factor (ECF subfamily)
VAEIAPDLYRYFLGNFAAEQASDLVQETLIRLVRKQEEAIIDSSKGSIKQYSFGIARFVRLETLKQKSPYLLVEDQSELDIVQPESEIKSNPQAHLRWAISQLKPIEQELILQMLDDECTFETISERMDMPVGTVKSHIHRAKQNLKKLMEVSS